MADCFEAKRSRGGPNLIRKLDPRIRIVVAAAFAITIVSLNAVVVLGLGLAIALSLMALADLPPGATLRRMASMDGFIIIMIIMLPFTTPGDPIITAFGWPASRQGLLHAIRIALKANTVILALMSLVGSMESITLGQALHRLGVPENLVHLMFFTIRYIDVIRQEYLRLRAAMKARGFRPSNSRHCYRSFGYMVGMMLVRAFERSERILQAMKCRGFSGVIPILDDLRCKPLDFAFLMIMAGVLVVLLGLERYYVAPV
ncbi:cobalt/nickel transport system permease protein [Azospirillaceae bacterium]